MPAQVLSSVKFDKYDADATFRQIQTPHDRMEMEDIVKDKWTAVKMHLGRRSAIPPFPTL